MQVDCSAAKPMKHLLVALRYHRIEVLGALASVLSTWLVTGILLWEAVNRIMNPVNVNGKCNPPPALLSGNLQQSML